MKSVFVDYIQTSDMLSSIVFVAGLLLALVCLGYALFAYVKDEMELRDGHMYVLCGLLMMFVLCVAVHMHSVELKAETYTLYLDGEQVARETVELSFYTAHCDDENQVIYLTRR